MIKIFFISECPKLDDLKASYKDVYCLDKGHNENGLCNCPPETDILLPKRWYIQYERRTGPFCNACREPNQNPEPTEKRELSVTPTKLNKTEYEYQHVCKVSKYSRGNIRKRN